MLTINNAISLPDHWHYFARGKNIKKNKIYTYDYFNTSFICIRNKKGVISIFSAYCPHLGAHIGVGGRIEKERIVCPFHGWEYDTAGKCVKIPYCDTIPKRAALTEFPSMEIEAEIYFYYENEHKD